jgi:hypothetical protein
MPKQVSSLLTPNTSSHSGVLGFNKPPPTAHQHKKKNGVKYILKKKEKKLNYNRRSELSFIFIYLYSDDQFNLS